MKGHGWYQREIIGRIHWRHLKIFFSRTTEPTQTWQKAFQGEENSNLFKWRVTPIVFPKGIIVKIHWRHFKIFYSRNNGLISKLAQRILWWRWLKCVQMEGYSQFQREIKDHSKNSLMTFKSPHLQNKRTNFNPFWHIGIFCSRTTGPFSTK